MALPGSPVFPYSPLNHWRRVWVSPCAIGGLRYAERFRAEQIDVLRFAMILAVTLSAISVSITTHAQPSDEDIARAKEKLKSALEDQVGLRAKSATDNDLSAADYNRFRELDVRIRPMADDLAAFMMRPPMPGDPLQTGLDAAVRTQDCMIRLAESFDGFRAKLSSVGTLVGLATKMVDTEDLLLVKRVLSADVWSFLGQLKFHQQILSSTVTGKCSQDSATLAKGQEISRIYSDAGSLVQSVVKKVGERSDLDRQLNKH
jgi:hypothetical protein